MSDTKYVSHLWSIIFFHVPNDHYEIALSVPKYNDVDLVYADVISKGAESVMEPTTEPWGQRTCYIADPEGNLIEIGSFSA
ncbi:putative glyoxalase superfamily protein PhnB [Clostridium saccharobutylicum]|nr:putative glyoxalase superfamily protein PhnB [Clostridium saccharobutylicum]NSB89817.1 putative glyoxalase superfamily protein PhnB [Clostridium saccharobutylicum]NSB99438.1 putative glyoxalase superfamily protein PhnB [Clostridium saccharobutylicum]NYD00137.1 putative glyoxalase superfamily protein PhnB [Clostridium saccharobutylicum]